MYYIRFLEKINDRDDVQMQDVYMKSGAIWMRIASDRDIWKEKGRPSSSSSSKMDEYNVKQTAYHKQENNCWGSSSIIHGRRGSRYEKG